MDTLAFPLVLTKLCVPAARPRHLSRARLINRLGHENGSGVIPVCAPAGYGKTTLFVEWAYALLKAGAAVAWYALDTGDDNPIPLGSYLIASIIQALGPILELTQAAQLFRSSPELDLQRIQPVIINAVVTIGRDCVLILDDYHLIGSRGPALDRLLVEAVKRGICRAYIERILERIMAAITGREETEVTLPGLANRTAADSAAGSSPFSLPSSFEPVEPLSERKLEVLRLISCGATNQAIAEQLVITVGTVKSHINHILGKLDAHNRTEAVARARTLHLLEAR